MFRLDKYGNRWPDAPDFEFCPECGQPDNSGDCDHTPLSPEDVKTLGGDPARGDWPLVDLPGVPALSRRIVR
jgi:hypothetical protein